MTSPYNLLRAQHQVDATKPRHQLLNFLSVDSPPLVIRQTAALDHLNLHRQLLGDTHEKRSSEGRELCAFLVLRGWVSDTFSPKRPTVFA